MKSGPTSLARALRAFFADHLPAVRGVSPHTVCSYRDAFTLLLRFLAASRKRSVVKLDFNDVSPKEIIAFLHRETVAIMALPDIRERLAVLGFEPVAGTPEEFARHCKLEFAKWAKVIEASNIKAQ